MGVHTQPYQATDADKQRREVIPDAIKEVRQMIEVAKMIKHQVVRLETAKGNIERKPEPGRKEATPNPPVYIELEEVLNTLSTELLNVSERLNREVVYLLGAD
jgi:hypothetical protein